MACLLLKDFFGTSRARMSYGFSGHWGKAPKSTNSEILSVDNVRTDREANLNYLLKRNS